VRLVLAGCSILGEFVERTALKFSLFMTTSSASCRHLTRHNNLRNILLPSSLKSTLATWILLSIIICLFEIIIAWEYTFLVTAHRGTALWDIEVALNDEESTENGRRWKYIVILSHRRLHSLIIRHCIGQTGPKYLCNTSTVPYCALQYLWDTFAKRIFSVANCSSLRLYFKQPTSFAN
jgi:hypothetical protein